jgi:hypothetical protein
MNDVDPVDGAPETTATGSRVAVLRHPLVVGATVAVVSAVLASLLIPALTRVWQDRARELALKRDLVERISTSATETVDDGNLTARYGTSFNSRSARHAYIKQVLHDWEVRSSVIGSQLNTYFHETSLPAAWRRFEAAVRSFLRYEAQEAAVFYRESKTHDFTGLTFLHDHFRRLRFGDATMESKRQAFASPPAVTPQLANQAVPDLLLAERDELEDKVVEAEASGFSHGFWIFH